MFWGARERNEKNEGDKSETQQRALLVKVQSIVDHRVFSDGKLFQIVNFDVDPFKLQ